MNKDTIKIKRYIETNFSISIKRTFWEGVSPNAVGLYLYQLNKEKEAMKEAFNVIDTPFRLENKFVDDYLRAFDNEIELAEFYLEYHKAKKDPNFNKWVFLTEIERNKDIKDDWRKCHGDCWTRSNGRIKATIEITNNISSTKVRLFVENDSKMVFIEHKEEINCTNLRNKESINKKIEEYKLEAEGILLNTLFPRYCYEKRQFDALKDLLQIKEMI